ncbi:sugar kinase [Roseivirga sp.]|uniref:sugar kinase n=1 Tax=Roseivirga sp. TaxID=1964215 RepID=UPI003B5189EC
MIERAVIIRDKTRLEQLIERFNSKAQAKFYIERSGGNFDFYEKEHNRFYEELQSLTDGLDGIIKTKVVFRAFLMSYIFSDSEVVLAIGQDGLVANTAKYLSGQYLAGINPDPDSYDGVLLPFTSKTIVSTIKNLFRGTVDSKTVRLAKAVLSDGQELLAFNDFFIGTNSHVSSRYKISFKGASEIHSSSGIIVSTSAGSTGWLSSMLNMAHNLAAHFGIPMSSSTDDLNQRKEDLIFTVREPFASVTSQTNIGFGIIEPQECLTIESRMAGNGVIFSDGIEKDFLSFNAGTTVRISIATQEVNLLI